MVELIAAVDGGHLEALYIRLYGAGVTVLKDRYNACIVQEDLLCLGGQVLEKIGMSFLDNFEFPDLSKYHPLKRHVRYYIELLPSQSEG